MKHKRNNKGQVLIMLVVFISIMTVVTTMAVNLMVNNGLAASKFEQGVNLSQASESGAERALVKLLRDPNNYVGETFTIDGASVTVNITGTTPKTLLSVATIGSVSKTIQLIVNNPADSAMVVSSWQEIY